MNERASRHEHPAVADNAAYRLACALVTLGEGKVAIDLMRRKVNAARRALTQPAPALFRVLTDYAAILESMDALAEAEFIRAEVLEIVAAEQQPTQDGVEALLRSGLLLCKMHNYDGAIARLREAVSGAEELSTIDALDKQIILAEAWRSQAEAFEALGEFTQASNALDVLMNVKRQIRFLVFSMVS